MNYYTAGEAVHSTNFKFTVLERSVKTVYIRLNHNVRYVNVKYCNSLAGLITTCLSEIYAVVSDRSMSKGAPFLVRLSEYIYLAFRKLYPEMVLLQIIYLKNIYHCFVKCIYFGSQNVCSAMLNL
jgi:hypothetical protein